MMWSEEGGLGVNFIMGCFFPVKSSEIHGGHSLMVELGTVDPWARVRFSLTAPFNFSSGYLRI